MAGAILDLAPVTYNCLAVSWIPFQLANSRFATLPLLYLAPRLVRLL